MNKSFLLAISLVGAILLGLTSPAPAQILYGIGGTDTGAGPNASAYTLFNFNSATPGSINTVGTVTTTSGYSLQSIAFQPGTGQLFGFQYNGTTNQGQLITINMATAAVSTVGSAFTIGSIAGSAGNSASISFNPINGAVRLVTGTYGNYRINPTTGALLGQDPSVGYGAGDPNTNNTFQISSLAYNPGGTLYDIDYINGYLATQNLSTGVLTSVGPLGITATEGASSEGFTIGSGPIGFLNTSNSTQGGAVRDHLYSINLMTGATTDLGLIGGNATFNTVDIAAQAIPEPGTTTFLASGLVLLAVIGYRRLRSA